MLRLIGFLLAVRKLPQPLEHIAFLRERFVSSLLELSPTLARREHLHVAEDQRDQRRRCFGPTCPRDVELAGAAHAVLVEERGDPRERFGATLERSEPVEERFVVCVLEIRDDLRMRTDYVGDIEQRETHLGRVVVRRRLRQRIGGVRIAEPLLHVLVDPRGRAHRCADRGAALWFEQVFLQLLQVLQDELEQRRP